MVTLRIGGYDVRRVLVDQGSAKGVSSTLHQKVKYPSEGLVKEILGNQSVAKQCMVAAILHKPEAVSSDFAERPS